MNQNFLPQIPEATWRQATSEQDSLFDLVTQPIHEELYRRQDFGLMEQLTPGQQMLLAYDYIQNQVLQGGFLQLIQNKYISLLLPAIEGMEATIQFGEMIKTLDDVLKVYVLNLDALERETTVEEFAGMYDEFKEFEILDNQFSQYHPEAIQKMNQYISEHPDQFVALV